MSRVLIARLLDNSHLEQIAAVDSAIEVIYDEQLIAPVSSREELFYESHTLDAHRVRASNAWPRDDRAAQTWAAMLNQAEVMFDLDWASIAAVPAETPSLRWIQTIGAGVAGFYDLIPGLRDSSVRLVAAGGVHSEALADFALCAILAHAKQFRRLATAKAQHRWEEFKAIDIGSQTACVVGFGSIGEAVGARLSAIGMSVIGVARRPRSSVGSIANSVVGPEDLRTVLPLADHVIVTLPDTPETRGLLDEDILALTKPGAYLVNVGRGTVIDEHALVTAVASGHLGGAALDVFACEPLPADSALWDLDAVIISPHTTALMPSAMQRIVDLLCENLRRDLAGDALLHVVDPDDDY